jgi:hypothetical protein
MKCPFCKRELVRGENRRYETLCDHVSNPNMTTHPLRPTFVCSCELSQYTFWDEWGDYYVTDYDKAPAVKNEVRKKYGDKLNYPVSGRVTPSYNLHAICSGSWTGVRRAYREHLLRKWLPPYR